MSTTAPDEHSSGRPPTLYERRVYFEALTELLLNSGVHGHDVGRMVAELDLHVAMVGTAPVEELGPVADVARSLRKSSGGGHLGRVLVASTLLWASVGLAIGIRSFLRAPDLSVDSDGVSVMFAALAAWVGVGSRLMRGLGASSRRGGQTSVRPSWRAFALYMVVSAVIIGLTSGTRWDISRATAIALLAVSAAVALASGLWLLWRRRVRVPGDPPHLRGLGWRSLIR